MLRKIALAIAVAALGTVSGIAASAATAPAPSNLYGCVDGSNRVLEHVYTVRANFENYLNNHNGSCPNGFPVSVLTAPSPSPTPTTPTPTPTPTTTTTTAWKCVTSSFTGQCEFADPAVYGSNTTGASWVRNQVWNPISGMSETMRANGLQDWEATANVPKGNTAVVSWPDSEVTVTTGNNTPDPLSGYSSLTSSLTIIPQEGPGTSEDLGWDVWGGTSGNSGTNYDYEMMVWTNQIARGTCGGATVLTRATFGSQTFTLCRNGPAGPTSEYIWYLSDSSGNPVNETSSSIDIYAMLQWMINNGYYPSSYGLNQVTVGSEVCSTGGVPETITLSKWTLTAGR